MSDVKLVYIGNKGFCVPNHRLTINMVYSGRSLHGEYYSIECNDHGVTSYYHRSFFKDLEEIRNEKLELIGIWLNKNLWVI